MRHRAHVEHLVNLINRKSLTADFGKSLTADFAADKAEFPR